MIESRRARTDFWYICRTRRPDPACRTRLEGYPLPRPAGPRGAPTPGSIVSIVSIVSMRRCVTYMFHHVTLSSGLMQCCVPLRHI